MAETLASPTALLCLLPGLGDALTASTIVRRLASNGYSIDVLAMLHPVAEYAAELTEVRASIVLPLLSDPIGCIVPLLRLRAQRYDLCVVPFPATRWQYAAVAAAIGAKRTISHEYGGFASVLGRAFERVPLEGGHRLWENDRLADRASLRRGDDYSYLMPPRWRSPRRKGLLGVHPGTMVYKGNEARRWPFNLFIELVRMQLNEEQRIVRVFFGPNEREDEARLLDAISHPNLETVALPLSAAARALAECEVFVGNDAGFSHIAAGLGVKTLALFGMTSPSRAIPVGEAVALRPSDCIACHDEGMRGFACVRSYGYRCLTQDLTVAMVNVAVRRAFETDHIAQDVERSGSFRLYGIARTGRP